MCCDDFEMDPISDFETQKKNKWRQVHYYATNLSIMIHKVKTDFLSYIISSIDIDLARVTMRYTYKVRPCQFQESG